MLDIKLIIPKLKQIKWALVVNRSETPLFRSYTDFAYYYNFRKVMNIPWKPRSFLFLNKDIYFDSGEFDELNRLVAAMHNANPNFFSDITELTYEYMDKLLAAANIASRNTANLNMKQLKEKYHDYDKVALDAWTFLMIMVSANIILSNEVKELIKSKSNERCEEYFGILVFPKKVNESTIEEISLLKIASTIKNGNIKNHMNVIRLHLKMFGWIGARNLWDTEWTEGDIIKRLKILIKGNPKEEIEYINSIRKENEANSKKIISELRLSGRELKLINVAKEFAFLRTYRTDCMHKAGFIARPLFVEIAKALKITYRELIMLNRVELLESLEKRELTVPKEVITERLKEHATLFLDGKFHVISGRELHILKSEMAYITTTKITEVKGHVAYPGRTNGKVKIITSQFDLPRFKEGDIFVAAMTFPNYMAAMEKAAAFVTDEGGILCHAAIIAREIKKPCIIGTKVATKLLKDGDLVEVDADKGIVRKL